MRLAQALNQTFHDQNQIVPVDTPDLIALCAATRQPMNADEDDSVLLVTASELHRLNGLLENPIEVTPSAPSQTSGGLNVVR